MTESRCYICFGAEDIRQLINPCACNSVVHSFCIEKFENINDVVTAGTCNVCCKKYAVKNYGMLQKIYRKIIFTGNDKIYLFLTIIELFIMSSLMNLSIAVIPKQILITVYSLIIGIFCGGILAINYTIIKNQIITKLINSTFENNSAVLKHNFPEMFVFVFTIIFPLYYAIVFSTISHLKCAVLFTYIAPISFVVWVITMGKVNNKRSQNLINYPKYYNKPNPNPNP